MSYDAVIFDFDGVLVDSGFDGFQWALEARQEYLTDKGLDVEIDMIGQGLFAPRDVVISDVLERQNISWNQFRNIEEAVAERKIEMASSGELELFDDVKPVLEELESSVAIVSNAYRDYLQALLIELGIAKYIGYYNAPSLRNIRNYRERMKPEPVMIHEVLDRIGADEAVMIGDQIEDVIGANRAGIDSVYIDRNGGTEEKADHSVKSLKDALRIIED